MIARLKRSHAQEMKRIGFLGGVFQDVAAGFLGLPKIATRKARERRLKRVGDAGHDWSWSSS